GQAGWAGAVADGAAERLVLELLAGLHAAQVQAAAAHVAPADERRREQPPVAENLEKDVGVLAGGDAAEKDRFTARAEVPSEREGGALERLAVAVFGNVDGNAGDVAKIRHTDAVAGVHQAAARDDDQRAAGAAGRAAKPLRVGELAAEVQAAGELEEV